ncbi:hypothetical protein SY88_12650 [Clostridiales bacterium PH28_bin88]|nr:hypothetical protein SY88_12650 [Clostridiales bacterium PH28_bin88]
MMKTVKMALETCVNLQPWEKVCIVTDTNKVGIAEVFAAGAHAIGAETVMVIMTPRETHGNEPPEVAAAAMLAADVILAPTTFAITHTEATKAAMKNGARVLILRGITEDIMIHGAITADYAQVKKITEILAQKMSDASTARVTSPSGTDITMSLAGRQALALTGTVHQPGTFAPLPDGEAAIVPLEGTANGIIVIDHTMDGIGLVDKPITLEVREGKVVDIHGGTAADKLKSIIQNADENATNIAELAIGTNPKARLVGSMTEDKKMLGSVHIAVGDNHVIGGHTKSKIHLDGLLLRPTVFLDDKKVAENSNLYLD